MPIRSYHALSPLGRRVWPLLRHFMPARSRFFFEGSREVRGQLWFHERKALFETVRQHRPRTVFEVGTWEGGGSTFFIAEALFQNGAGKLVTIEVDEEIYERALSSYRRDLPHLVPYVDFHRGAGIEVYPPILEAIGYVDAVLLDGEQEAQRTLDEYRMFDPYLRRGSLLMMHDWTNEKTRLLRELLEGSKEWEPVVIASPKGTVGLAVFRRS